MTFVNLAQVAATIAAALGLTRWLARKRRGLAIGAVLWLLSLVPCIGLAQYGWQSWRQAGNALDLLRPIDGLLWIFGALAPSLALVALVLWQRKEIAR